MVKAKSKSVKKAVKKTTKSPVSHVNGSPVVKHLVTKDGCYLTTEDGKNWCKDNNGTVVSV